MWSPVARSWRHRAASRGTVPVHDRNLTGPECGLPVAGCRRDDRAMSDYTRYCPISMGSDVIADRWTPLIVRELVLGNTRFNDIARGLPGISRSLLTARLRHLEKRGVVERWSSEYHLTPAGRDLEKIIDAFGRWAVEWLFDELYPH